MVKKIKGSKEISLQWAENRGEAVNWLHKNNCSEQKWKPVVISKWKKLNFSYKPGFVSFCFRYFRSNVSSNATTNCYFQI